MYKRQPSALAALEYISLLYGILPKGDRLIWSCADGKTRCITAVSYTHLMSISLHGNFNDMDFTKVMEEKTNVHIDWKVVPNGNEITEAKTLAFASGNMPDMFFITDTHMTNYDVATYGPQGLIAELNELIDGYAPNLSAIFAEHPEYKTMISDTNGRIYSLPAISNETKNHSNYKNKMYINRKWLDTLGLSCLLYTSRLHPLLSDGGARQYPLYGGSV